MFAQFKISKHVDVIIPLGKGSVHDNLELRYCLRSIVKHVPDVENVFIIGQRPSFLRNIIHVAFGDNPDRKFISLNIFRKVQAACLDKRVSDNFYFFSDDHFLLSRYASGYYSCGTLAEAAKKIHVSQSYHKTISNTYNFLGGGTNFNVHCPIVYNKKKFLDTVAPLPWRTAYGFAIKSIYCNLNGYPGSFIPDLKIKMSLQRHEIYKLIKGRPFFSIGDVALNASMKEVLQELYPQKSEYES